MSFVKFTTVLRLTQPARILIPATDVPKNVREQLHGRRVAVTIIDDESGALTSFVTTVHRIKNSYYIHVPRDKLETVKSFIGRKVTIIITCVQ